VAFASLQQFNDLNLFDALLLSAGRYLGFPTCNNQALCRHFCDSS